MLASLRGRFWSGRLAEKSCFSRFGAMLNEWAPSVVILNLRVLMTEMAFTRINRPTRPSR